MGRRGNRGEDFRLQLMFSCVRKLIPKGKLLAGEALEATVRSWALTLENVIMQLCTWTASGERIVSRGWYKSDFSKTKNQPDGGSRMVNWKPASAA